MRDPRYPSLLRRTITVFPLSLAIEEDDYRVPAALAVEEDDNHILAIPPILTTTTVFPVKRSSATELIRMGHEIAPDGHLPPDKQIF
jgi:hypothetical protein